ncbi:MAG: hypothetical protein WD032_03570 [Nitrospirales bacterium]
MVAVPGMKKLRKVQLAQMEVSSSDTHLIEFQACWLLQMTEREKIIILENGFLIALYQLKNHSDLLPG